MKYYDMAITKFKLMNCFRKNTKNYCKKNEAIYYGKNYWY